MVKATPIAAERDRHLVGAPDNVVPYSVQMQMARRESVTEKVRHESPITIAVLEFAILAFSAA